MTRDLKAAATVSSGEAAGLPPPASMGEMGGGEGGAVDDGEERFRGIWGFGREMKFRSVRCCWTTAGEESFLRVVA